MKKSTSSVFSAQIAAASVLALSSLAAPFSALAASDDPVSANASSLRTSDAERAQARGILLGDLHGSLGENKGVTRAEFAAMVARAFGLDTPRPASASYKDLSASSWASPAVEALRAKGWMSGSGSAFLPNAPVTQEQMAVVLAKALSLGETSVAIPGAGLSDADLVSASAWAREALKQSASAGLLGIYANGVKPGQAVLRGEAASAVLAASNLRPQTLESANETTVKLGGVTYGVAEPLRGLFAASNAQALAGAKVRGYVSNGILQSVYGLELNAAGSAAAEGQKEFGGNAVLDGGGSKVDGSVTVNGDFYTLNDLNVGGDLTISAKVGNDFFSSGLTVGGTTYVQGGDSNTVVFDNAKLDNMTVDKREVRVSLKSGTTLSEISVQSDASVEGDSDVKIPKLTLGEKALKVALDVSVQSLEVKGNSSLTIGQSAKIENLKLPSGADPSSVIANYSSVIGRIGSVNGQSTVRPVPVTLPAAENTNPAPSSPSVPQAPQIDKTALKAAIADAETAMKEAPVGGTVGTDYPELSYAALSDLHDQAQIVLDTVNVTQTALNEAAQKLIAETKKLRESKNYTQITRSLALTRDAYASLSAGTHAKQVSQAVYDKFQTGLADIESRNPNPFLLDEAAESELLDELISLAQEVNDNLIAWDVSKLEDAISHAEVTVTQYPVETTNKTLENLNVQLAAAKEKISAYQSGAPILLQKEIDNSVSILEGVTASHINKSNQNLPNPNLPNPNLPNPVPTPDPAPAPTPDATPTPDPAPTPNAGSTPNTDSAATNDPNSLVYNEESDSLEPIQ